MAHGSSEGFIYGFNVGNLNSDHPKQYVPRECYGSTYLSYPCNSMIGSY